MNRFDPVLDFAAYLADPAWGSSAIRAMRQGPPARVIHERRHQKPATDAMRLGTACHLAAVNLDAFHTAYAHKPDGMSFATNEGKTWRKEQAGRIILTHDEWSMAEALPTALLEKPVVAEVYAHLDYTESSLFWDCAVSGESCKGRPDWIAGGYIYDLKITRDAASPWVAHRAFASGYMHQLAHYRDGAQLNGLKITGGRLIMVDPTPPQFIYAFEVKRDALDLLQIENIATLMQMRACREANLWPGTPDEWVLIEPPAAALNSLVTLGELEE
jgi:hypothetical protein